MLITLIIIAVIIVGIVCMRIDEQMSYRCPVFVFHIGIMCSIIGFVASLFAVGFIIGTNVCQDVEYQNALYEKEVLEYRINNMSENIVGNELLYNDIVEFNNELRSVKKWANSPWTNWFNNEDIATIDYIELDNEPNIISEVRA